MEIYIWVFYSSPEPKAQVSFSDQNLSVIRCHRCFRCRKLFTFSSSSPEPGPVSTKLGTNHPWVKGILDYSNDRRAPPFPKGRWLRNSENTLKKLKNLLLQNHQANFNQTQQKASLGKEDLSLCTWKSHTFSHCEIITTLQKVHSRNFKNLLLLNYWASFILYIITTSLHLRSIFSSQGFRSRSPLSSPLAD